LLSDLGCGGANGGDGETEFEDGLSLLTFKYKKTWLLLNREHFT
jgi:hypothetical protein